MFEILETAGARITFQVISIIFGFINSTLSLIITWSVTIISSHEKDGRIGSGNFTPQPCDASTLLGAIQIFSTTLTFLRIQSFKCWRWKEFFFGCAALATFSTSVCNLFHFAEYSPIFPYYIIIQFLSMIHSFLSFFLFRQRDYSDGKYPPSFLQKI